MIGTDSQHTGRYGNVDRAPVAAVAAAAAFVEAEWGDDYHIGLCGPARAERIGAPVTDANTGGHAVFVFQVLASDGGRFCIWADQYGNRGEVDGPKGLAWLAKAGIDAYVSMPGDQAPKGAKP